MSVLSGEQLAEITREMVRIKHQHYGKGAENAKSYLCDSFLFCVMKGGLTAVEQNLIEHGDERLVRQVRLRFQDNNRNLFCETVQRIAGRPVLTYESQVLFDPDYVIEIFLLGDGEPLG